jgi:hypothetical protein
MEQIYSVLRRSAEKDGAQRMCIYEIIMLEKCLSEQNVFFLLTYSTKQIPSWEADWFCS